MSKDRRPLIAGTLNFIIPGLGLLYLGCKRAALVNFVLVNALLLIFTFGLNDPTLIEHVHYVFLALAALSAGYAHGVAGTMHDRSNDKWNAGTQSP